VKVFIPLIIFFIEKHFNEKHFTELELLKKEMVKINPNVTLFCITESVDKKLVRQYNTIKDCLYVVRCNFKGGAYKDLQPQVFLSLYNKLYNYANKELPTYESIVPFGNIDLVRSINE
jgi:hypothetical protein